MFSPRCPGAVFGNVPLPGLGAVCRGHRLGLPGCAAPPSGILARCRACSAPPFLRFVKITQRPGDIFCQKPEGEIFSAFLVLLVPGSGSQPLCKGPLSEPLAPSPRCTFIQPVLLAAPTVPSPGTAARAQSHAKRSFPPTLSPLTVPPPSGNLLGWSLILKVLQGSQKGN